LLLGVIFSSKETRKGTLHTFKALAIKEGVVRDISRESVEAQPLKGSKAARYHEGSGMVIAYENPLFYLQKLTVREYGILDAHDHAVA
jgi:hypothetical protein